MVSGTTMSVVDPLGPVCLGAEASMDRTCSSTSHRCLIGLGSDMMNVAFLKCQVPEVCVYIRSSLTSCS